MGEKYNYVATNQEKMSEAVLGGLTLSTDLAFKAWAGFMWNRRAFIPHRNSPRA